MGDSAAVLVGSLTYRWSERGVHLFSYTDALAMGVYGVYGANWAMISGIAPEAAVLVGLCNAVGGGMIRDVLVREEPLIFKPGQLYAIAALVGCILFVALSHNYGWEDQHAAWLAIASTLLVRAARSVQLDHRRDTRLVAARKGVWRRARRLQLPA